MYWIVYLSQSHAVHVCAGGAYGFRPCLSVIGVGEEMLCESTLEPGVDGDGGILSSAATMLLDLCAKLSTDDEISDAAVAAVV